MTIKNVSKHGLLLSLSVILFFLLSGCTMPPSKNAAKEVITKYFEAKRYKVVEIEIGNIKPIPINEQRYMGTKGYLIDVKVITLEATEDIGSPVIYKKGEKLTFNNGRITIREKSDKKGDWIISNIFGIAIL